MYQKCLGCLYIQHIFLEPPQTKTKSTPDLRLTTAYSDIQYAATTKDDEPFRNVNAASRNLWNQLLIFIHYLKPL